MRHLTAEQTEAQRGCVTCPGLCSLEGAQPGFELGCIPRLGREASLDPAVTWAPWEASRGGWHRPPATGLHSESAVPQGSCRPGGQEPRPGPEDVPDEEGGRGRRARGGRAGPPAAPQLRRAARPHGGGAVSDRVCHRHRGHRGLGLSERRGSVSRRPQAPAPQTLPAWGAGRPPTGPRGDAVDTESPAPPPSGTPCSGQRDRDPQPCTLHLGAPRGPLREETTINICHEC